MEPPKASLGEAFDNLRRTKAFPSRGRWPEGPDEVATNEKLS